MSVKDGMRQEIRIDELLGEVQKLKRANYRLVQISCTTLEAVYELYYTFEQSSELKHLLIQCGFDTCVPSITSFYQPAFLYENEIHDLFGIDVAHMSIDYQGSLYQVAEQMPFGPKLTKEGQKDE
ncbi:MAG: NADH-quinone oxidoreductase subunit C [Cellulosilyticaceae bacterium]